MLGPILFVVYIDDFRKDIISQVPLFAVDTAIHLTLDDDSEILQKYLDRLQAWENKWDMEFNPSKCQVIRVASSRTPLNTQYILRGQVLEVPCRYLEVDISSKGSCIRRDRAKKDGTRKNGTKV